MFLCQKTLEYSSLRVEMSLDCPIRDNLDSSLAVGKSHPELEAGILPFSTASSLQALCRALLGEGAAEGQRPLLLALGLLPGVGQDTKDVLWSGEAASRKVRPAVAWSPPI